MLAIVKRALSKRKRKAGADSRRRWCAGSLSDFELLFLFKGFLKSKRKRREILRWFEAIPPVYWSETKNCPLHVAANQKDTRIAKYLFSGGYRNVNLKNARGETPLTIAIASGNDETARWLLGKRAIVDNAFYDWGIGPLHLAAEYRRAGLSRTLLASGARVNALDWARRSPLQALLERGGESAGERAAVRAIAEALARAGADLNRTDASGRSPLYLALSYGYLGAALVLVDHGAVSLPGRNEMLQNPLHQACRHARVDLVRRFLDDGRIDVDASDVHGARAIHYAVRAGCYGATRALIARSADVNALDGTGMSPLCHAVRLHAYDLAKLLVDCGAATDTLELEPAFDPLLEVIRSRSYGLLRLLLRVRPNLRTGNELECLEIVAEHAKIDLLGELLQHGARSVSCRYFVLFGLLLYGEDVDSQMSPNERARLLGEHLSKGTYLRATSTRLRRTMRAVVAVADEKDICTFVERLSTRSSDRSLADLTEILRIAAPLGREDTVLAAIGKSAREGKFDVDGRDGGGYTLLHHVVAKDNVSALEYLLALGARVDLTADNGDSPLLLAVRGDRVGCVESLLRHSTAVEATNYWIAPLHQDEEKSELDRGRCRVIRQIAILLLVGGLSNGSKIRSALSRDYHCELFYRRCREELESMRDLRLSRSMTLLDALMDSESQSRDPGEPRIVADEALLERFQCYRDILEERLRVSERSGVFIGRPLGFSSMVFENVFRHPSNGGLRRSTSLVSNQS